MNRRREFLLVGLVWLSALSCLGPARASVPDTVCRLQSQTRLDPATLAATMSTPTETYRFANGKVYVSSPDRPERYYNDVTEVEFRKRFTAGHKTFIFTEQAFLPGTVRMLAFHFEASDIRVGEFACTR
jgi:hypothetical protein